MIGLIALGGIIVRQSILIVEFVKFEVAKGKTVTEAAVAGAEIRMRPIFITVLTLPELPAPGPARARHAGGRP